MTEDKFLGTFSFIALRIDTDDKIRVIISCQLYSSEEKYVRIKVRAFMSCPVPLERFMLIGIKTKVQDTILLFLSYFNPIYVLFMF